MADDFENWLDSCIVSLKDKGMITTSAWELAAQDGQRMENERRAAGLPIRHDSAEMQPQPPGGQSGGDYYQFTWDGEAENTMFSQEFIRSNVPPMSANNTAAIRAQVTPEAVDDTTEVTKDGDGVYFRRESFRSDLSYGELSNESWEYEDQDSSGLEEEIDSELYNKNTKPSSNGDNVFNAPSRTRAMPSMTVRDPRLADLRADDQVSSSVRSDDSVDSVASSRRSTAGSEEGLILGNIVPRPAYSPRRKPQRTKNTFQMPYTDHPKPYSDKATSGDRILLPMDEYEMSMDEDEDDDHMLDVSLETADGVSVNSDTQPIVTVDQATLRQQWAKRSRKSKFGILGAVVGGVCVIISIVIILIVKFA